jgi:hypothetical protein
VVANYRGNGERAKTVEPRDVLLAWVYWPGHLMLSFST